MYGIYKYIKNAMEQNTVIISLTKENYTQHLPITPVAFSVAEGGADIWVDVIIL